MQEMIDERRQSEVKAERHDLFNSLLDANMDEENMKGGVTLDDSELLGNIFIFLLAGHEVCLLFVPHHSRLFADYALNPLLTGLWMIFEDDCTYPCLFTRLARALSGRGRATVSRNKESLTGWSITGTPFLPWFLFCRFNRESISLKIDVRRHERPYLLFRVCTFCAHAKNYTLTTSV